MIIEASRKNKYLPRSTEDSIEIYRKDGRGRVNFLGLEFNSTSIFIEILIDGLPITSFNFRDLTGLPLKESHPIYRTSNALFLTPRLPFIFKKSFVIKAKASTNSSSKYLDNYIINFDYREALRD